MQAKYFTVAGFCLLAAACGKTPDISSEQAVEPRAQPSRTRPTEAVANVESTVGPSTPTKEAAAADATPRPLKFMSLGGKSNSSGYKVSVTANGETQTLYFNEFRDPAVDLKFSAEPGAEVTLASSFKATANDEGIATFSLSGEHLASWWLDNLKVPMADNYTRLSGTVDWTAESGGAKRSSVKLSIDLTEAAFWGTERLRKGLVVMAPAVKPDARGLLAYNSRVGFHYAGPAGTFADVRYLSMTHAQAITVKNCGNYINSLGSGKLQMDVQDEYTWMSDRTNTKVVKEYWTKAKSPCKKRVTAASVKTVHRPGELWAIYTSLTKWTRLMMKQNYWGKLVRVKAEWGTERAAVLRKDKDGQYCVRFRRNAGWDACFPPNKVKLPKNWSMTRLADSSIVANGP